jgi:hypothetical protein
MRVDASTGIANFQEDVYVADDAFVSGSLEAAGIVVSLGGFSGSLTKLSDGGDYLLAGANIMLATESNGAVTITAVAGSPDSAVQFNSGGSFTGDASFTFTPGKLYMSGAFSQGFESAAYGDNSHAEGKWSMASGMFAHAEGDLTTAGGQASHAEGSGSLAMGIAAHAEGYLSSAPANYSHAEGWLTIASGSFSHVEGKATITSGSWAHAEGVFTVARGAASHAEGSGSLATGIASHAEGKDTTALGDFSHAAGFGSLASGYAASAIGFGAVAAGNYSFAAGEYVVASGSAQSAFGKWNKENNGDSLFIIGAGSSDEDRKDIFLVGANSVMVGSASLAADTFFHVATSGAADKAKFDGSVLVDGFVKSESGFSGSLTKLANGDDYMLAGVGITLSTGSNGAITVSFNTNSTAKGYYAGNSAHLSGGVFTFGPAGAALGTLSIGTDEFIDVYLNGVYMSCGANRDITNVSTTSFSFNSNIASTLTSEDVISVVLRCLA